MYPQEPNIPTVSAENPIPPPVPKDNHWMTILSMAVFVLLSLGAVAFLYYQNQQLKGMLANYQTSTASPTPVATPDPTANWKTHTDKSGQFSFKYPSNLVEFAGGVSGPINGNPKTLTSFADNDTVLEGDAPFDGFSIYSASLEGKSFGEYIKREKSDREKRDSEFWEAAGRTIQSNFQSWVMLNGPAFPEITVYYLQLPDAKNVIAFARSKSSDNFPGLFDQILSTFKFLGAEVGMCKPGFPIETNMPELTASENYAIECTSKKIKNDCLLVDIYNAKSKDFSKPDGVPDCDWTDSAAKACAQEAKLCPDGSSVGRTGPNCEFSSCPQTSY